MKARRHATGFTLLEVIMFIVIAGVLVAGLFAALGSAMYKAPKAGQIDRAADIAQQRMELILAQRRASGFATLADACPGPTVCTLPTGYAVAVTIANNWAGDTNYKVVTVDVTGLFAATATALVANY